MKYVEKIEEILNDINTISDEYEKKEELKNYLIKLKEKKEYIEQEQNLIRYDPVDGNCVVCNTILVMKMMQRFHIEIDEHQEDKFIYGYDMKCIMCPRCGIIYEELPKKEVIYE